MNGYMSEEAATLHCLYLSLIIAVTLAAAFLLSKLAKLLS